MKKILRMCFVMVFLSMHWMAFGQGKTITGKVTDDAGLPLPGVSVVIEGTTDGTITDFKGQYSLLVPADKQVLVYSFIGFKTVKLEIADRTVINLKMDPEVIGSR
jgi:TonB-dependent starch-binding outer membrane protein SusC